MGEYSFFLDKKIRGELKPPNPNNDITVKRKRLGNNIMNEANGNESVQYQLAVDVLNNHKTRLQEFVLSHGEAPAYDLNELIVQTFQLKNKDIAKVSSILGMDNNESLLHIENEEQNFYDDMGYVRDEFLGELLAPVEIAYTHLKNARPDNFLDPSLISAGINMVGTKVNSSTLKRAAQGKPVGLLGKISTGGKAHYAALVAYFRANPDQKQAVLSGRITDESELPGWVINSESSNRSATGLNDIYKQIKRAEIKKYVPYIIAGVLLIVLIVYIAARHKK